MTLLQFLAQEACGSKLAVVADAVSWAAARASRVERARRLSFIVMDESKATGGLMEHEDKDVNEQRTKNG